MQIRYVEKKEAAVFQNIAQYPSDSCILMLSIILLVLLAFPPAAFSFFLPTPPPPPGGVSWGCPTCNETLCPPPSCEESLRYTDGCGCCILCARLEGERCGGDGEAGGRCNGSSLICIKRPGSIFGEERMGICEPRRCQRKRCGYRERCGLRQREEDDNSVSKRVCHCDYFRCENKLNLVCGRNGQTYSSVCSLRQSECLSGEPIGLRHFNECEPVTTPTPQKPQNNVVVTGPPPVQCIHNEEYYSPFHIVPPSSIIPCTYHVCSEYGVMEQYPVLGCEGNPPEMDWQEDELVRPAEWTDWSPWTTCIGDCDDGGWHNRSRNCTNPPPSRHREVDPELVVCAGESEQEHLCEPTDCTICNMSIWSEWSSCSNLVPCQVGSQYRTRKPLVAEPTVPELCEDTFQSRSCQILEDNTCEGNCSLRWSRRFKIYNTTTRCTTRRYFRIKICAGACQQPQTLARRKSCSNEYTKINQFHQIFADMDCEGGIMNHITLVDFLYKPTGCKCKISGQENPPRIMSEPWKLLFDDSYY